MIRRVWGVALGLVVLAGCGQYEPPRFTLNLESHDPDEYRVTGREENDEQKAEKESKAAELQTVANALEAMFGTPDEPYVFPELGLDKKKLDLAAGRVVSHEPGKTQGLYRKHCAHCHGVSGDGAGPTAVFMTPYPRDYRQGKFKFKSTIGGAKPTRRDLVRVLDEGLAGSYMPSFKVLLTDKEKESLVEYVIYLAMRGEAQAYIQNELANLGEGEKLTAQILRENVAKSLGETWADAENKVVTPAPRPADAPTPTAESIAKGRDLFLGRADCKKCHGFTALGDGLDNHLDSWNKPKEPFVAEVAKIARRFTLPLQYLKPRNLRLGVYRAGASPEDIYRRVFAGIPGAEMPGAGEKLRQPNDPDVTHGMTTDEIWYLVDYVRSLPDEPQSRGRSPLPTIDKPAAN